MIGVGKMTPVQRAYGIRAKINGATEALRYIDYRVSNGRKVEPEKVRRIQRCEIHFKPDFDLEE